ncbi:MAG: DUF1214 domain-containing protein [Devosia sp.]
MRFLIDLFVMLGVALLVGFGLSYYALTDGRLFGAYQVGPWVAWPRAGSPSPDPYTRAYLTRNGALQLGLSEGLQFASSNDSDGRPLERSCNYRIDGTTPLATFWTLIPVTADGTEAASPDGPPGFHSQRVVRSNDGSMHLHIGPTLSPDNWLEVSGTGPYSLVLTLYDTAIFSGISSSTTSLPAITRESCR